MDRLLTQEWARKIKTKTTTKNEKTCMFYVKSLSRHWRLWNSWYHARTEAVIVLKRYRLFYYLHIRIKGNIKKFPTHPFCDCSTICTPISLPCSQAIFPYRCHSRKNQLPNINTAFIIIYFFHLRAEQKSEALLLNIILCMYFYV